MTPDQITEALDEIASHIVDAHNLIARLGKQMGDDKRPELDVVYGDIWADAGLGEMSKRLRIMESQLVRFQHIEGPEHYERLRTGVP